MRPSSLVFAEGFRPVRLTLVTKRALDLVAALVGGLVTLPLVIAIAVAIRLDSRGPVFVRQERSGQLGRMFLICKFRSTSVDEPDPRVTRVGRWLQRTRLDGLPQIFNVLSGDMSLIGPRPERFLPASAVSETVPLYLHRLAVKPGITGWAQVNRPDGAMHTVVETLQYDLYYVKNISIFLDLLILLQTVQTVLLSPRFGTTAGAKASATAPVTSDAWTLVRGADEGPTTKVQ